MAKSIVMSGRVAEGGEAGFYLCGVCLCALCCGRIVCWVEGFNVCKIRYLAIHQSAGRRDVRRIGNVRRCLNAGQLGLLSVRIGVGVGLPFIGGLMTAPSVDSSTSAMKGLLDY